MAIPADRASATSRRAPAFFTGCLLGGAVGDALGAPVEFWSLAQIRTRCSPDGVREFLPAHGRTGAITDDTQMTLFTAEGLLRAHNRRRQRGVAGALPAIVYHAYLRWLETQGVHPRYPHLREARAGRLLQIPTLHSRRAPGNTCLSALQSGVMGTVEAPLNMSKGCGGVMRVAPVGLAAGEQSFRLGCELAAITHGHPSGYLSAGFLAEMIARIVDGDSLPKAVGAARTRLQEWPAHDECLAAVDRALDLAETAPRTAETVEQLGGGWTGEEALAISLFCALTADSFEDALSLAVSHSGDSDSTGAITGNILGALWGVQAIPARWLDGLELREVIDQVAVDFFAHVGGGEPPDDWETYPPS